MQHRYLLSQSENKLLISFVFLICCLFYGNLIDKTISDYNQAAIAKQIEKQEEANKVEKISFSDCHPCVTLVYEILVSLQFFFNPFIFFLLLAKRNYLFLTSTVFTSFSLLGFVTWMLFSYESRKINELFVISETTLNTYILYKSTALEAVLFLLFSTLFVLQISVLLRFVIEKFQAKISI